MEKENNIPEINKALFYAMELTGFKAKNLIQDELDVIISFLDRKFRNLEPNVIRMAFELGVGGDLDIDLTQYQNFNALYVTNAVLSYKRYLRSRGKSKIMVETKPVPALTFDQAKYHAAETEKYYLNGDELTDIKWTELYNYYKNEGKISFTPEEMHAFKNQVKIDIQNELKEITKRGKTGVRSIMILEWPELLGCECRKRAVLNYYKTLK